MEKYNIFHSPFSHTSSSTWYKKSNNIIWENNVKKNNISFYVDYNSIDQGIIDKNDGKKKFLWILESPVINIDFENKIKLNLNEILETYELIFTYSDELIKLNDKFVFCPANGHWIDKPGVFNKTKMLSMITSSKSNSELQKFRVKFANDNKNKLDLFGSITTHIPKKEIGLNDYMFSVCIENCDYDTYFTEKILDCFATGTIPIYKGTKKIVNHFNPEGILFLDDLNIDNLTSDIYYSKVDAINENFDRVRELYVLEDFIYNKYLKNKF